MNKATVDQAKSKLDRALCAKNQIMLDERMGDFAESKCDAWQNLYYANPNANNAKSVLDRHLAAYQKHFGRVSDALSAACQKVLDAASEVMEAKAAYEQAKTQKKADKAAAVEKRKAPPVIVKNDATANALVVAAVTEIAQGFKAQVKAQYIARYRGTIEQYAKKLIEKPGHTDPYTFWPASGSRFEYACNAEMRAEIGLFLNNVDRRVPTADNREQLVYAMKPEAEVKAIIEERSERQAEEAIQGFIYKMAGKLAGILDQKRGFQSCHVTGTLGQNSLVFIFDDGASFTIINDIIVNWSCLGKPFNQYPTRFTNVKIRTHGSVYPLKGISEGWMKRMFKDEVRVQVNCKINE